MRLPLLAAVAVATAALPLAPANAAVYPVCATQVVSPGRTTATCSAGNTPYEAIRLSRVEVETGAVDATLTCYAPFGNRVDSARVYAGNPVVLSAREYSSCTTVLTTVTPVAAGTVVSYPVPVIYHVPPPPTA